MHVGRHFRAVSFSSNCGAARAVFPSFVAPFFQNLVLFLFARELRSEGYGRGCEAPWEDETSAEVRKAQEVYVIFTTATVARPTAKANTAHVASSHIQR
jgi:hypothetical protein